MNYKFYINYVKMKVIYTTLLCGKCTDEAEMCCEEQIYIGFQLLVLIYFNKLY
jgi:hypothetical protein